MREDLFDPLGMAHTTLEEDFGFSCFGTAADMAKLGQLLLNFGATGDVVDGAAPREVVSAGDASIASVLSQTLREGKTGQFIAAKFGSGKSGILPCQMFIPISSAKENRYPLSPDMTLLHRQVTIRLCFVSVILGIIIRSERLAIHRLSSASRKRWMDIQLKRYSRRMISL